jgi:hypothetical protein
VLIIDILPLYLETFAGFNAVFRQKNKNTRYHGWVCGTLSHFFDKKQ